MSSGRYRVLRFTDIRGDWYVTNTAIPRAVLGSLGGVAVHEFVDFPRHWLPFFAWFGLQWSGTVLPRSYVPFYSDASEADVVAVIKRSKREATLRALVESSTIHDPVLADCLYIVDQRRRTELRDVERDLAEVSKGLAAGRKTLFLNGWQSYGRPCLRTLEEAALAGPRTADCAIVMPCALRRPYERSHTHKKIHRLLASEGVSVEASDKIVMTSLGVLPESVWKCPQVLGYTAGVPDIYRLLRLARAFFCAHRYDLVLDCLQFEPYSDILRIVEREGHINELRKVRVPGRRPFWVRTTRTPDRTPPVHP